MMRDHVVDDQVTPSLRLVRRLGAGGMGTVWIARHQGLQADVVVKFITGELARNHEIVARFQREAASASEVRSPHVVQMFDHGVSSAGLPYIAMEMLEGEDLAARIARDKVMSPGEVAGVVLQVARALSRAHEKKIVHRDIKPENIFLCETGEDDAFVKVLDFGIAKVNAAEQLGGTATGAMLGSPYWMSPEQVMGSKAIDHRTDLWSLGMVAFYALTGKRAFEAETIGALSVAICTGTLPVPSQIDPRLSPSIDAWFASACAREVSARFPSARAMADALVAAVGGPSEAHVRSRSLAAGGKESVTRVMHADMMPSRASSPASTSPHSGTEMMPSGAMPPMAEAPAHRFASTTGPASIELGSRPHEQSNASSTHGGREAAIAVVPKASPRNARIGLVAAALAVVGSVIGVAAFAMTRRPSPASVTTTASPPEKPAPPREQKPAAESAEPPPASPPNIAAHVASASATTVSKPGGSAAKTKPATSTTPGAATATAQASAVPTSAPMPPTTPKATATVPPAPPASAPKKATAKDEVLF